ncbi:integrase [Streptomyces sp. WAC02707]|uniref:integrase n=1 Tax=Streptomyces sp. WAC02707 TaxID=2487417 RepID=UPI000F769589|nr:integrase [Streptomyces sp. WAC02707]RSS92514.1 integrase [Streptomyces sp. WAC02707]
MPYPEQRGNKWRVRWNTGKKHPETGRWLYDSKGGFDSREDAIAYGLDRESDIRNDRYISRRDGDTLMSEYCRTWQQTLDVGHLRRRNIESYIRLYIEPRWGDMAVADIRPSAYRAWELWLKDQPNIGDRYRREILLVFSMMMDDAVNDGMRQLSPVPKQRKRGRYVKTKRERKRPMLMADVHQLATNAATFWGFPGYVYVLTMACTGMRPAEAYALRREYCYPNWPGSDPRVDPTEEVRYDEDLERYAGVEPMPALRVEWQHQREDGELRLFPPKYESRRTLVVPQFLAELLEMLLASHESEWVFPSINGGELAKANFTYHYWRPIADGREASVPRQKGGGRGGTWRPLPKIPAVPGWVGKRQYLLRHGHKEWLDEDGHSRIAVESRMGHELAGVEGLYGNVTPAMEMSVRASLQERWLRFAAGLPEGWEPESPSPLPVGFSDWVKVQVSAGVDLLS